MIRYYINLHCKMREDKKQQHRNIYFVVEIKDEASFSNTSNHCLRDQDKNYMNKLNTLELPQRSLFSGFTSHPKTSLAPI